MGRNDTDTDKDFSSKLPEKKYLHFDSICCTLLAAYYTFMALTFMALLSSGCHIT